MRLPGDGIRVLLQQSGIPGHRWQTLVRAASACVLVPSPRCPECIPEVPSTLQPLSFENIPDCGRHRGLEAFPGTRPPHMKDDFALGPGGMMWKASIAWRPVNRRRESHRMSKACEHASLRRRNQVALLGRTPML